MRLLAGNAQIVGQEIKVWDKYHCLGWWTSQNDRAIWTIESPKAARYAVWLNWSCDDESAGSKYVIEGPGVALRGKVASTGGWDVYRDEKIGEVDLTDGASQLTVRADGPIPAGKYLFDLKEVRLEPLSDISGSK
jgi:hypothetical protein